jgi:hypothetical protein
MGEHSKNPDNQPTHQNASEAVDPRSVAMPRGTQSTPAGLTEGAEVGAYGGAPDLASRGSDHETPTGANQPGPQGPQQQQPLPPQYPPWQYADPSAVAGGVPQPGYPGSPNEFHAVSGGHGYYSGNPGYPGYGHHYPPYAQMPPPYYTPYPPGYPAGNPGAPPVPPHGGGAGAPAEQNHRPDMNQLINGIANGDANSLSSLGQLMNFDDKEFWKGALIGAAAVLLLTNDSVQSSLFRAGGKATQAMKSGMDKVKKAAAKEQQADDETKASDG